MNPPFIADQEDIPMAQIDIENTPYSYSPALNSSLDDLSSRVAEMRSSGGRLSGDALAKIRKFFRIKSIYHSNAIEGNILDVGETRQVVEHGLTITGKPLKDQAEAKNLSEALDLLEDLAKTKTDPIREIHIRQIHQLILKGISDSDAGNYRTVDVEISGSKYRPYGPEEISIKMEEYATWLSSVTSCEPEAGSKNAILHAAVAHTWFVTIHPFIDGNGRTARLILNLMLMRAGFPIAIITKEDRQRYYDSLEESQASDLSHFISLLTESIEESLEEYEEAMKENVAAEEWAQSLASKFTKEGEVKVRNEFEVWRHAMELLRSHFKQITELMGDKIIIGKLYFNDFGSLEYEKYLSLRAGRRANRTWFFRIDFIREKRTARYLFLFGHPSRELRSKCRDVALHVAREEPPGSFNYERLEIISQTMQNIPTVLEIGYMPEHEEFVVRTSMSRSKRDKIESLGKRFFNEVVSMHFSND